MNYVLRIEEPREKINRMKVQERVDSDHQPITVWVKGGGSGREKRRKKGKRVRNRV